MAWQYWWNRGQEERRTFITLDRAYHGDTIGAMSVSAESSFTDPFKALLFPVTRTHEPYCYRCPVGLERSTCQVECLHVLESLLHERGPTVAAVLVEPMLQGVGGSIVWPIVGDVRVIGGVGALELVSDPAAKAGGGYFDEISPRLAAAFLEQNLLIRPLGTIVYFMPPYVITDDEAAWALDTIAKVLRAI